MLPVLPAVSCSAQHLPNTPAGRWLCTPPLGPAVQCQSCVAFPAASPAAAIVCSLSTVCRQLMCVLSAAASTACTDNDKVQVNAIRALGNLFAIQHCASGSQASQYQPDGLSTASSRQCQPERAVAGGAECRGNNESSAHSCDQLCGPVSGSQYGAQHSCWWGEHWLDQGIDCLLMTLDSSTDKVWPVEFSVKVAVAACCQRCMLLLQGQNCNSTYSAEYKQS